MFQQDANPDELSQIDERDKYTQQIEEDFKSINHELLMAEKALFSNEADMNTEEGRQIYLRYVEVRLNFIEEVIKEMGSK